MPIDLSGDREHIVRSIMQGGRFTSEAERTRVLEGIRRGIEDRNAGRSRPADEVFADIRREFNLSPDA